MHHCEQSQCRYSSQVNNEDSEPTLEKNLQIL